VVRASWRAKQFTTRECARKFVAHGKVGGAHHSSRCAGKFVVASFHTTKKLLTRAKERIQAFAVRVGVQVGGTKMFAASQTLGARQNGPRTVSTRARTVPKVRRTAPKRAGMVPTRGSGANALPQRCHRATTITTIPQRATTVQTRAKVALKRQDAANACQDGVSACQDGAKACQDGYHVLQRCQSAPRPACLDAANACQDGQCQVLRNCTWWR